MKCSLKLKGGLGVVSILVLMDLAHELNNNCGDGEGDEVSILVLMDLAHEFGKT